MKNGEFSGHSIDEAVFHGLMELGLSIDEVTIETLQNESKGLFGIGAKMARVRLTERAPGEVATEKEPISSADSEFETRERSPRRDDSNRDSSRGDVRHGNGPRGNSSRGNNNRGGGPRENDRRGNERRERTDEDACQGAMDDVPQYDYQIALAQEHAAGKFLAGLLAQMGIEGQVLAAETEDGLRLRIDSATKGLLIGRRGETLDALQYVTSLVVNRDCMQEKYQRVTIDTEDYRSKREDTLRKLARRQASRVKATGRSIAMEPMNPYERRVLHASLQGHPYVTTYSEGEEPNRRVVIAPK